MKENAVTLRFIPKLDALPSRPYSRSRFVGIALGKKPKLVGCSKRDPRRKCPDKSTNSSAFAHVLRPFSVLDRLSEQDGMKTSRRPASRQSISRDSSRPFRNHRSEVDCRFSHWQSIPRTKTNPPYLIISL